MTYTLSIEKDGEIVVRLGVTADEALAIVGRAIPKTADIPETSPALRGPRPPSVRDKQQQGKVERTTTGRKKTECHACGQVGHTSRSQNCPLKTGAAAAPAREPNRAEQQKSEAIKKLLRNGHDDDFAAAETLSSPRVVAFIRKQMVSRGEL